MSTATLKTANWSQVGNKATDAAASVGEMVDQAANAIGSMAKQAACNVGQKADDLTAKAGYGMEHLGDAVRDRLPHDGVVGNASQTVARFIQHGGQYLEEAKLSGATESLKGVIRKHPVESTLAGLAIGYLVARALRN